MAIYVVISVAFLACLAMVKGTFVNGRFERSYTDNGFDDSGIFVGDDDFLGGRDDDSYMHEMGSYVGGGIFNRGIGESLSGGILGGGAIGSGFGSSRKFGGMPRIGGGIGGIQRGIRSRGGILGGGRRHFGKFGRGRVSAGLAGFARRSRPVVGMGGILGARRRSWKMY